MNININSTLEYKIFEYDYNNNYKNIDTGEIIRNIKETNFFNKMGSLGYEFSKRDKNKLYFIRVVKYIENIKLKDII